MASLFAHGLEMIAQSARGVGHAVEAAQDVGRGVSETVAHSTEVVADTAGTASRNAEEAVKTVTSTSAGKAAAKAAAGGGREAAEATMKAEVDAAKASRASRSARPFFENSDRFLKGAGQATMYGAGAYAAVTGVNYARKTADDLKDAIKYAANSVSKGAHAVEHETEQKFKQGLDQMHKLESGAKNAFSGQLASTATEGVLSVVLIGSVVYILYEGFRYYSKF